MLDSHFQYDMLCFLRPYDPPSCTPKGDQKEPLGIPDVSHSAEAAPASDIRGSGFG